MNYIRVRLQSLCLRIVFHDHLEKGQNIHKLNGIILMVQGKVSVSQVMVLGEAA